MKFLVLLLPASALVFRLTFAQLQTSVQKLFSCDVTKYQGVLYQKDSLLGENGFTPVDTFQACVEKCLMYTGCKAVNFLEGQGLCGYYGSGLANAFADPSSYDNRYPNSIHGVIVCDQQQQQVSSPVGCGRQASFYQPSIGKNVRIIGGGEATPHSWPWLVSMFVDFGGGFGAGCGASLLRIKNGVEQSDIVVTAAHCVTREDTMATNPEAFPANQMTFTAGEHNTNTYDNGEQRRKGVEVRFHQNFKFTSTNGAVYDIAMIKLDSPLPFSDTIRPICLPQPGEAIPVGRLCVAAGWGRTSSTTSNLATSLQQVYAPAQDPATCSRGWNSMYQEDVHICAGSLTGTAGTCQGDSGGELACQNDDGSWTLYGATSFGVSGTCLEAGKPSIFTRLSSFMDWITTNMNEMSSLS